MVPDNVQVCFRILQDTHSKVHLPNELRFVGSQKGLKTESRELASVIASSAHYGKLALKVLGDLVSKASANPSFQVADHLDDLPHRATEAFTRGTECALRTRLLWEKDSCFVSSVQA